MSRAEDATARFLATRRDGVRDDTARVSLGAVMEPEEPKRDPMRGLSPDQAMQMLSVETSKRRRIATANQSGTRLVTMGLALGVCAGVCAWLLPPSVAVASWVIGVIASLVLAYGALKLLAAWQLSR